MQGKLTNLSCGNCAYNCCCYCEKENCYYCKNRDNFTDKKCSCFEQSDKYICFTCQKGWKVNVWRYYFKKDKYGEFGETVLCSSCRKEPIRVSPIVRTPKYKDKKAWLLLEKIILSKDLENSKPNTLANKWTELGGMGCTLHMHEDSAKLFWVPNHMRDYDRWVAYMRTTNYE